LFALNRFCLLTVDTVSSDAGPSLVRVLFGLDAAAGTLWNVVLVLLAMLLITKGGDVFTDSAVAIARATRVPTVIIGATIVSVATTFPEFMVSLTGTLTGVPAFAVGNALGSCCCNIGLIVGTSALLKGILAKKRGEAPGIPVSRLTLLGPGGFMLAAGLAVWVLSVFGNPFPPDEANYAIARWQGGVLAGLLVVYLVYSFRSARKARFEVEWTAEEEQEEKGLREHILKPIVRFVIGACLVSLGSKLMVSNAEVLALAMGVPKLVVGLTVLAVGTSLPEYTISLLAVIKGHGALGVGNIIGANVLNITWVIATCALISPLPIERQTVILDTPLMLLLMSLMLTPAWRKERISAWMGAVLLGVYCGYLTLMFTVF